MHYTTVLLGCADSDGTIFIVDEHAVHWWLPDRHTAAIEAMVARQRVKAEFGSRERGDDAADALRYLVATRPREVMVRKLTGL